VVGKAQPVISWTNPAAITYGTALSSLQLNATSSVAGSFSYTPTNGAVLPAGSNTLTAIFTASDTTNYVSPLTNTVILTVNPASRTITFTNKTKTYGVVPDPNILYSITPPLLGDDKLTGSPSRQAGENVGVYEYGIGTLTNSNYTLSKTGNGSLTIVPRPVSVIANNASKNTGEPDAQLTLSLAPGSSLASWDTSGTAFTGSLTRDPGETAGNYVIRQGSLLASSNYEITSFSNGVFTIVVSVSKPTLKFFQGPVLAGNSVAIGLQGDPQKYYQVQYCTNLATANWTTITPNSSSGITGIFFVTVPKPVGAPTNWNSRIFFRAQYAP